MITFKTLTWSNAFSYAEGNTINLDGEALTQLVGPNGSGKTSIPLILQEVLYGKNVKNIKKQDISNRHTDEVGYSITLDFDKDGVGYTVNLVRKASIKLALLQDGNDISSHTSVNTYKQIAEILGVSDFKIFTQLIYQSSTGSLEFLTATDTSRKKFLIALLQLERYVRLYELFKDKYKDRSLVVSALGGKLESNTKWINKHKGNDYTDKELLDNPKDNTPLLIERLVQLKADLTNIRQINLKVASNNQNKLELSQIDMGDMLESLPGMNGEDYISVVDGIANKKAKLLEPKNLLSKMKGLDNKCPNCLQDISEEYSNNMIDSATNIIRDLDHSIASLILRRSGLDKQKKRIADKNKLTLKFEELSRSIDQGLSSKLIQNEDLDASIISVESEIEEDKAARKEVDAYNTECIEHNARVRTILKQLEEFEVELAGVKEELEVEQADLDGLEVLKKVFSTNGLVSYKIESSVKELERIINHYLSEFSDFQIFFKLDKDKLNIKVVDDTGLETSIESLSAGELGRVNIATVLAIRSIMSTLTSTKINFLFLDEIVGVLDSEGRERLIEILLGENLNTFMVSHEYVHPLVPKLYINKKDKISRISDG
jgi:DNA repair exonuclease SbcCD ATPase subunit